MKNSRSILFAVAFTAIGLLGFALYLQFGKNMLPCPLCVIQRYAFAAVALICLIAALLPARATRISAGTGLVAALAGVGVASWHLWIKANPSVSCGIDPLETSLNKVFTAELLPFLFKADGLCSAEYAPILGLSTPQWSLIWFAVFAIVLGTVAFRRR